MNSRLEKLIYKSLDSKLTVVEKAELDKILIESPNSRAERDEILSVREMIGESNSSEFKPFFDGRVMHRIKNQNVTGIDLVWEMIFGQFRKIMVPAIIAIVLFISLNIGFGDSLDINTILGIPDVSFSDAVNPVNYLVME